MTRESELSWWLRRFGNRISLRLSPDVVEIASVRGVARSSTVVTVVRTRDGTRVAGIGDDPTADAALSRIRLFQSSGEVLAAIETLADFLRILMKRLPPSGGILRPVVVVEGIESLDLALGGRHRDIVIRALEMCGAAAAVLGDAATSGAGPARRT